MCKRNKLKKVILEEFCDIDETSKALGVSSKLYMNGLIDSIATSVEGLNLKDNVSYYNIMDNDCWIKRVFSRVNEWA